MRGRHRGPSAGAQRRAAPRRLAWVVGAALLVQGASAGEPRIAHVRVGVHPGYARVVFETDRPAGFEVLTPEAGEAAGEVVVRLAAAGGLGTVAVRPGAPTVRLDAQSDGSTLAHIRPATGAVRVESQVLRDPPRVVLDLVPSRAAATAEPPGSEEGSAEPGSIAGAEATTAAPEAQAPAAGPATPAAPTPPSQPAPEGATAPAAPPPPPSAGAAPPSTPPAPPAEEAQNAPSPPLSKPPALGAAPATPAAPPASAPSEAAAPGPAPAAVPVPTATAPSATPAGESAPGPTPASPPPPAPPAPGPPAASPAPAARPLPAPASTAPLPASPPPVGAPAPGPGFPEPHSLALGLAIGAGLALAGFALAGWRRSGAPRGTHVGARGELGAPSEAPGEPSLPAPPTAPAGAEAPADVEEPASEVTAPPPTGAVDHELGTDLLRMHRRLDERLTELAERLGKVAEHQERLDADTRAQAEELTSQRVALARLQRMLGRRPPTARDARAPLSGPLPPDQVP